MYDNRIALSVREAATACGYSPEAVRRAIQQKTLVAERPGGKGDYRIMVEDLREWLRGSGRERIERNSPHRPHKSA